MWMVLCRNPITMMEASAFWIPFPQALRILCPYTDSLLAVARR
jgi:hypothetical protein